MKDPIPAGYYNTGGNVGFRRKTAAPGGGGTVSSGVGHDFSSPQQNPVPNPENVPSQDFGDDNNIVDTGKTWTNVGVAGQGGYQTTGSSKDYTPGNFNIIGGNKHGYKGSSRVGAGLALQDYSRVGPQVELGGFSFGLLPYQGVAGAVGDKLIGHKELELEGAAQPVYGTAGSFEQGASDTYDFSGGATGGNVATNKTGGKVSVGYGYGQVDPAIAKASGYTTGQGGSGAYEQSDAQKAASSRIANYNQAAYEQEAYGGGDSSPSVPAGRSVVTDSSGNAVTSSSGVVTSKDYSSSSSDDSSSGGGK